MTVRKPPFDPDSPGAQKLLRAAQEAADQVDVVITMGFVLDHTTVAARSRAAWASD